MQATETPFWRSHPVLCAALLGAALGLANVVWIELGGWEHHNSQGVMALLAPSATFGIDVTASRLWLVILLLIVQVGANILIWALLFAAPVAMLAVMRRILRRERRPRS